MIRSEINTLRIEEKSIRDRISYLQELCEHKTSVYSAHGSTGNWDRDDSYWYSFFCYDCQKRWSTDQSVRPIGSMKVDKIDYDEKPAVVELKMKIEEIKR